MGVFNGNCLGLLIGSLPMDSHEKAARLVFKYTPEIPLWVQLPAHREEGMIEQFLPGLPGLAEQDGKRFLDSQKPGFDEAFLAFFEDYLALFGAGSDLAGTRFAFDEDTGKGFFEFLRRIDECGQKPPALKGQVTGPVTFGLGVRDRDDRAIFFNEQLKDATVKKLAGNAGWQAGEFSKRGAVPIIFIDEPALAGFGTSAYITISREDVIEPLEEVIQEIHAQNGLAGIHVCANTEWGMLLDSSLDIISFDAHTYFDRFILYPEQIRDFMGRGGQLAWGNVPTADKDLVEKAESRGLENQLLSYFDALENLGIKRETIRRQSFITPSCGTGSLDSGSAEKVLELTRDVSAQIRKSVG